MLLLPKRLGSFTLVRKLGTGGVSETFAGTYDVQGGRPVVIRYVLPYIQRDTSRLSGLEARIRDLLGVRHPFLVQVFDQLIEGEDRFVVEEYIEGVTLDRVLAWCRQTQRSIPPNVFLNIATQICNGLEALHGRTGKGSSSEHVLHLGLKPGAVFLTPEGKVVVGSYGLVRSPTSLPHGGVSGPVPTRMEYLSPEQTHPDQKLTPASDIFALGAILYELLTLESLFRAEASVQTIHRIRRAEVSTQMLKIKELMPGLDKILFRALALNPRHRYQRAFVLREDLRGLMAGYSFATINEDTRAFLAPLLESCSPTSQDTWEEPAAPDPLVALAAVPEPSIPLGTRGSPTLTPEQEATDTAPSPTLDPAPAAQLPDIQPPAVLLPEILPSETLPDPAPLAPSVSSTAAWLPEAMQEQLKEEKHSPEPLSPEPLPSEPLPPESPENTVFERVEPPVLEPISPEPSMTSLTPIIGLEKSTSPTIEPIPEEPPPPLKVPAPVKPAPPHARTLHPPEPEPVASEPPKPAPPSLSKPILEPKPPAVRLPESLQAGPLHAGPPPKQMTPPPSIEEPLEETPPQSQGLLVFGLAAVGAVAVIGCLGIFAAGWSFNNSSTQVVNAPVELTTPAPIQTPAPIEPVTPAPVEPPVETPAPIAAITPLPPEPTPTASTPLLASVNTPVPVVLPKATPTPLPPRENTPRPATATPRPTLASLSSTPEPLSEPSVMAVAPVSTPESELDRFAANARSGRLSSSDISTLEAISVQEPAYTRSRALLLMNSQAKGDDRASGRYLDQLMLVPENQYNPVYLADQARIYVNAGQYEQALKKAELAERYWARLPSELVFSKKAEIYEIQAKAWQGRFYKSPDQLVYLDNAIRAWEKYQQLVAAKGRSDLEARAKTEIAKLQSIQEKSQ